VVAYGVVPADIFNPKVEQLREEKKKREKRSSQELEKKPAFGTSSGDDHVAATRGGRGRSKTLVKEKKSFEKERRGEGGR